MTGDLRSKVVVVSGLLIRLFTAKAACPVQIDIDFVRDQIVIALVGMFRALLHH